MNLTSAPKNRRRVYQSLLAAFVVFAFVASASGQASRSVAVEYVQFVNFPVEMIGLEVDGKPEKFLENTPLKFDAAFDAPEDWLRNLVFKMKNRTDRTIVSIEMHGGLATTAKDETPMHIEVRYGQELDDSMFTGRPPRGEPGRLLPGETADVRWTEAEYAGLVKILSSKRPVGDYRKMRIDLREVRFSDGTVWTMGGRYYRIDPNDPRKWTSLDKQPDGSSRTIALNKEAQEKVIEVSSYKPATDTDVIVISDFAVAGKAVTPGQVFTADENWLRNFSVRVKNLSTKPIAHVRLSLSVPEAHYQAGGVGIQFRYGKQPQSTVLDPNTKLLMPNEEADIKFTDEEYEQQMQFAYKLSGVSSFSRLRVGAAFVVFSDGTRAHVINAARTQNMQKKDGKTQ